MFYIELTDSKGKTIFVNAGQITTICYGEGEDSHLTKILFINNDSIWVKETPKEVMHKISDVAW